MKLSAKWALRLTNQPETGMGYQVATILLNDGRRISKVTIVGGVITKVAGYADVPFSEAEIADIVVTH